MHDALLKLYIRFKNLMSDDEGQDLVEYALIVALIALGAVTAMNSLAGSINTVYGHIKSALDAAPTGAAS